MKQTTRLLALSALVLAIMLGVFGAPALEAPSVAFAQGQVPAAPTNLTATRSGASTINLSWNAVTGAVRYQVYSWDSVDEWQRLDGGAANPHTTTNFAHQNLVADRLYYYQVYAVNAAGDAGPRSNRANEVAGQNAPGRPVLTPTPGYQVNVISWPAVSGAASYVLYAWDQSWSQVGGTITGTSYTHTGLTVGRTYYYEARAVNAGGVMGAYSAQVSATVLSTPTITAPMNLRATGDSGSPALSPKSEQITLTWQAPAGAGSTITGYEYRYAESTAALPTTWTDAGNVLTETFTGLTNGTQYTFEVRAMSSTGEGPAARVMATPAAVPDAPVLTANEGYQRVMLSWPAPANNGAAITGYRIEKLDDQSEWEMEVSLPGTSTSHTDTGLSNSTVYTYRIFAINAAGESGESNSASATTLAQPVQAPGPPSSLTPTAGPGMVTLNWAAPLFNGGAMVTGYQYRSRVAPATETAWAGGWTSAGDVTMVEVKPLTPGTEYEFQVRALNSAGAGEPATSDDDATATARTPTATGPTAVPRNLRATLGTHDEADLARHLSNATIELRWDPVPQTANGGQAIDGYELCYKISTSSAWMRWDDTDAGFGAATESQGGSVWTALHGATGDGNRLEPGTTYDYRVRAINDIADEGNDDTTCTVADRDWATVSATTPAVAPEAPTLLVAVDTTTTPQTVNWDLNVNSITIRWTAPATNGGADVTSYEVWVGTALVEDETTTTDVDEVDALTPTIRNLPAVRLEYISVGLTANQTYHYRVRARNSAGVSVWSENQPGTTTQTQAGTPGMPTALAGTENPAASGTVPLTWTGPSDEGDSPILHYEVQYQRDDDDTDDDWSDATTVTTTTASWTHMDAPGGSMMEYRVRAVNASGAGAWSDQDTTADGIQPHRTDVDARPASAPMLTARSAGTDEILLEWNTPQDNGTEITGYTIQRTTADATDWTTPTPIEVSATVLAAATVYADTGTDTEPLTAGTKYYYRIQANPGGTWSATTIAAAAEATTDMGAPEAPVLGVGNGTTTPTGFDSADALDAATTGPTIDTITLYWLEPSNGGSEITGYELRVWDGSTWAIVTSPAADDTSYAHEDLEPGTRYHYILAAINAIDYSGWSADVSGLTTGGNPDAIDDLEAVATGPTSIRLTWTAPDNNGTPIEDYELQRWDNADPGAWGSNLLADGDTVTEFVDTGLVAGTKYYYRVRAMPQPIDPTPDDTTAEADRGWSADDMDDATSVTTPGDTLGAPTALTVGTPTDEDSITFTWTAPTVLAGGTDISGYDVQIWNGSMWADEASLGDVTTYTDNGLMAGTKYYYRVRAKNSQGPGPYSAFASFSTTTDAPDAPVLMAAPEGMNAIRLTWNVPDNNGNAISGYRLQRWDASDNSWPASGDADFNLLGDTDTVTLFVDEGLQPGTRYHYRIQTLSSTATPAEDQVSAWSVSMSATTVAGRPSKPTLTATAVVGRNDAINLSWSFDDSTPANGNAIVRFELQRWDKDAGEWTYIHNALPSTRTSYRHDNLTADTRYAYRIRAVNRAADGDGNGYWSTIVFESTNE